MQHADRDDAATEAVVRDVATGELLVARAARGGKREPLRIAPASDRTAGGTDELDSGDPSRAARLPALLVVIGVLLLAGLLVTRILPARSAHPTPPAPQLPRVAVGLPVPKPGDSVQLAAAGTLPVHRWILLEGNHLMLFHAGGQLATRALPDTAMAVAATSDGREVRYVNGGWAYVVDLSLGSSARLEPGADLAPDGTPVPAELVNSVTTPVGAVAGGYVLAAATLDSSPALVLRTATGEIRPLSPAGVLIASTGTTAAWADRDCPELGCLLHLAHITRSGDVTNYFALPPDVGVLPVSGALSADQSRLAVLARTAHGVPVLVAVSLLGGAPAQLQLVPGSADVASDVGTFWAHSVLVFGIHDEFGQVRLAAWDSRTPSVPARVFPTPYPPGSRLLTAGP